ncbi:hypothetical protein [Marinactinospora rubrisoli]|uniref:PH domain-containing protein n=1 Tax=Marinactinospora rubrisoli TaxID=2715399 RepID=A0ABW2KI30_9ACTN
MPSEPAVNGVLPAGNRPAEPFVLKSDPGKRWPILIAPTLAAVLVTAGSAAKAPALLVFGAPVLAVLLALAWANLYMSRTVVTADEIIMIGSCYRLRRSWRGATRVVRATVVAPRGPNPDTVFVLDERGQVLARFYGHFYTREDIDRLVGHLRLPVSGPGAPVTARQLDQMYPGIVPWYERQPLFLAGLLVGVIAVIVVVVGVGGAIGGLW